MFDKLSPESLQSWDCIAAASELYEGPQAMYQYNSRPLNFDDKQAFPDLKKGSDETERNIFQLTIGILVLTHPPPQDRIHKCCLN